MGRAVRPPELAPVIPKPEDQPTMTVSEFAALVGVGRTAAYEAVRRGEVPSLRFRGRIVIPTAEVRRLLGIDPS